MNEQRPADLPESSPEISRRSALKRVGAAFLGAVGLAVVGHGQASASGTVYCHVCKKYHKRPACKRTYPSNKNQCKNGGWAYFKPAFRNQGQCIRYVNTGKDSRP